MKIKIYPAVGKNSPKKDTTTTTSKNVVFVAPVKTAKGKTGYKNIKFSMSSPKEM